MNIINFEKIDSTNTYAKKNIGDLPDKTVISADMQTAGRGRFERVWVDLGAENIYMTIVLKPSDKFEEAYSNLTQYLSLCLCHILEEMGLKPQIKWPNDVLLSKKKVCGILAETVFQGNNLKGIVLGIGVNLNATMVDLHQIDRPATSVNLELFENVDKKLFQLRLLDKFFANYDKFLNSGFVLIRDEYLSRASFLNQNLNVSIFNKIISGYSKTINASGNLVLILENGEETAINMGEIV